MFGTGRDMVGRGLLDKHPNGLLRMINPAALRANLPIMNDQNAPYGLPELVRPSQKTKTRQSDYSARRNWRGYRRPLGACPSSQR